MTRTYTGSFNAVLVVTLLLGGAGCTGGSTDSAGSGTGGSQAGGRGGSGGSTGGRGGSGGSGGNGGSAGSAGGAGGGAGTGGSGGSGGSVGSSGGSGGSGPADVGPSADTSAPSDGSPVADAPMMGTDGAPDPASIDYGGVGQRLNAPVIYTPTPTPPIVAPECPGDPTQGFTEYMGTFQVQRPHNLAAKDRMKWENGIYTFWVQSGDQAHQPGNTTAPRTEARYPNFSGGEHIWSADVMYETVSRTCVMQIHNVNPAIAMYLRVQGNRMFNLSTGRTILTDYNNKWFNLKVALNTRTLDVKIYVNNCLKESSKAPSSGTPDWYFKHGVYTCDSGTCRSNFKNIHLYKKD